MGVLGLRLPSGDSKLNRSRVGIIFDINRKLKLQYNEKNLYFLNLLVVYFVFSIQNISA